MDHIPTGTILQIILTDLALIVGLSALAGGFVARAGNRAAGLGLAVGALVPVVGPLVWGGVLLRRRGERIERPATTGRSPATYVPIAILLVCAAIQIVGMWLPWGHVHGAVQDYEIELDATPIDTGIGAAWSIISAAVAVAGAITMMFSTVRRRTAFILVGVAAIWLLSCLDSLILLAALRGATESVAGASGGRASADIGGSSGLWLALAAGLLMAGSALVLGWLPSARPLGSQRSEAASSSPTHIPIESRRPGSITSTWSDEGWGRLGSPSPPAASSSWDTPIPVVEPRTDSDW